METKLEEAVFRQAALTHHKVLIQDKNGKIRLMEPYLIYKSQDGKKLFSFFQTEGYSSSDQLPGWRNLAAEQIAKLKILKEKFIPRSEYNPDSSRYHQITFAI